MSFVALTIPGTGFEVPLSIVVLGFVTGLTYALLGMGLTLVYKSSRVLNFAYGEMGALPALLVPILVVEHGFGYWPALLLALLAAGCLGFLIEGAVIRPLSRAPRLAVLVATIGVAQILFVAQLLIPKGANLGSTPYPTPFRATLRFGSVRLAAGQLMIAVLVPLVAVGLGLFLRKAKAGRASRAAAENMEAAQAAGVPVRRVSSVIWIVSGLLAGVSAVLIGPTRPVITQAALGPGLMVRALGAATLGGLTSLPRVFAGGIAIGIVEALITWNFATGGAVDLALLVLIVGTLLLRRGFGATARGGERSSWSTAAMVRRLDPRVAGEPAVRAARRAGLGLLLAFAVLFPLPLSSSQLFFMTQVLVFSMMGLSLVVLTGYAGQVSLGQFAFVAVGATVGGRMLQLGYPDWTGILYAVAAGAAIAFVVGLPALRARGLFLAVTTLGFAVAVSNWMFNQSWLVHIAEGQSSLRIPRPRWLGIDFGDPVRYYWLCLALLILVAAFVQRLPRTGVGRAIIAVRDNEPSAVSFGISPARAKLIAFVISGAMAALAGYFYGALLVSFSSAPGTSTFAPEQSLSLVAMTIFGGVTSVTGAVVGALWVKGMPYLLGASVGLLSTGMGLLLILLMAPAGLASVVFAVRDRLVAKLSRSRESGAEIRASVRLAAPEAPAANVAPPSLDSAAIASRDVVVRFGGNVALGGVSIHARPHEILGLMGPNGAGKTTLFDVLSGFLRPASGTVMLQGREVTGLPPNVRARLGLGRTFQQARLFDDMTVLDAFKVALECREPSPLVPTALGLPGARAAERRKSLRSDELVDLMGLGSVAHRYVGELSTGTRRLAEIGCVVATGAQVLLLDEPTAGFSLREVEAFRPVVRDVRDHLDAAVVVVDHDVATMMGLVDRMYVLVAGAVIAEGPPEVIRKDPGVIEAYLGTDGRRERRARKPVGATAGP